VGEPNGQHVLATTQSGIMSADGEPDFTYWLFDSLEFPGHAFCNRFGNLNKVDHPHVKIVPHHWVESVGEFIDMEQQFIDSGYEGIMIRGPNAPYKFGRATPNEHSLFKFKRFNDGEAVVIEVLEGTRNENDPTRDATGKLTRSSHQNNLTPAGRVGTIVAREINTSQVLNISPGRMSHEDRQYYWYNPGAIVGKKITIKWFDYGKQDAPRFCTFQNIRMDV
jgi:DNA ligase-1